MPGGFRYQQGVSDGFNVRSCKQAQLGIAGKQCREWDALPKEAVVKQLAKQEEESRLINDPPDVLLDGLGPSGAGKGHRQSSVSVMRVRQHEEEGSHVVSVSFRRS